MSEWRVNECQPLQLWSIDNENLHNLTQQQINDAIQG